MTQYQQDISEFIERAKRVINPLSPISIFAARNPWEGLEDSTFDQVAVWLKNVRDIDIYPQHAAIQTAINRGEIDVHVFEDLLYSDLKRYMNSFSEDELHAYIEHAKHVKPVDDRFLSSTDYLKLEQWVKTYYKEYDNKQLVRAESADRLTSEGKPLIEILDAHIIKWAKLYLDDFQSSWTMPRRNQGFYRAWKHLAQHDPMLNKEQRLKVKDLPNKADEAIARAIQRLKLTRENQQAYIESQLLSLPGWAGMMYYRAENDENERKLLIDYVAVRLFVEMLLLDSQFETTSHQPFYIKKG